MTQAGSSCSYSLSTAQSAFGPNGGPGAVTLTADAGAYSLNVTVVPHGALGYFTIWPAGEFQPFVSTVKSLDGRIKANAAIVQAGTNGAVSAYPTNDTDVVIDINAYFVPGASPNALEFFPVTPCRAVDTRNADGLLGGPFLAGGSERDFPIQQSNCGLPSASQAYSLNFTAIPRGTPLGYLSLWPTGQSQPLVSTLNAPTSAITANAAIVPAGNNGEFSTFATDITDLAIDVKGYFAPPVAGGLHFYAIQPCRVLDTRSDPNVRSFDGVVSIQVAGTTSCQIPTTAQAYVINATVVPTGFVNYLSLWQDGATQPLVSTLNSPDGAITSNMAIVRRMAESMLTPTSRHN